MTQAFITSNLVRTSTFFQNAGVSITFVFLPIIAKNTSQSFFEIGLIIAAFSLAQILSSMFFGRISDKKGNRIFFIQTGFVVSSIVFALHYLADNSLLLFLARISAGIATGIMIPAMLAYSYESSAEKTKVASIISFQALGWFAGIIAAGISNDEKIIFLVSAGFFAIGFLFSLKLPKIPSEKLEGNGLTKQVIVKNKILFFSLLLRHIGATAVWAILPIILTENMGAHLYEVSIVYIANTLTSFVVMTMMATRMRINNVTKFKIGLGLTIFVFIGLALVKEWWLTFPFMALVGLSWAFLYIGGNVHIMENNPKSTSTGIFSSTISIASVVGPLVAGAIASYFGFVSVIYFASGIAFSAFLISLAIKK
jgi:DHA1 family multidrug resistance protein-like MFS transporter